MRKTVAIFILLALVVGAGVAYYQFNRKIEGLAQQTPEFTLSSDELFDAFEADEDAASLVYLGKVIEVSGTVFAVRESEQGSTVVLHAQNAMAGGVNCVFPEAVNGAVKGEQLTAKCLCQGFLMDVIMNNCYAKP